MYSLPVNNNCAVYAGSFDPLTNGHVDLIQRGAKLFDTLHIGVGRNPRKRYLFDADERTQHIRDTFRDLDNVHVEAFGDLLVDFCYKVGAGVILRGLRAVADFEYEFQMGLANKDLAPDIETLFLLTDTKTVFVSSSIVKEIANGGRPIDRYVPPNIAEALYRKLREEQEQEQA